MFFLCYVRAAASRVTDGRAGLRQAQPPNSSAARNGIWVRTHAVRPYISGCDSITALQQRDVRTRFIASSSRYLLVWDKGACPLVSWARAAAVHPQRIHTNNWLLNIYTESCGRDESRPYKRFSPQKGQGGMLTYFRRYEQQSGASAGFVSE